MERVSSIPTTDLTLSILSSPKSKNDCALSANAPRLLPISGNADDIPAPIAPMNLPITSPILTNIFPTSSILGISINNSQIPTMPNTIAPINSMRLRAATRPATGGKVPNIPIAPDKAKNNTDKLRITGIAVSTGSNEIANIKADNAITKTDAVIRVNPLPNLLVIAMAPDKANIKAEIPPIPFARFLRFILPSVCTGLTSIFIAAAIAIIATAEPIDPFLPVIRMDRDKAPSIAERPTIPFIISSQVNRDNETKAGTSIFIAKAIDKKERTVPIETFPPVFFNSMTTPTSPPTIAIMPAIAGFALLQSTFIKSVNALTNSTIAIPMPAIKAPVPTPLNELVRLFNASLIPLAMMLRGLFFPIDIDPIASMALKTPIIIPAIIARVSVALMPWSSCSGFMLPRTNIAAVKTPTISAKASAFFKSAEALKFLDDASATFLTDLNTPDKLSKTLLNDLGTFAKFDKNLFIDIPAKKAMTDFITVNRSIFSGVIPIFSKRPPNAVLTTFPI